MDGPSSKEHIRWLKKLCNKDNRIKYIKQRKINKGIYGAMNQGFSLANKNDWIFFWGSDDWVFSKDTFLKIMKFLKKYEKSNLENIPDLIIARGIYVDSISGINKRISKFNEEKILLNNHQYSRAMFFGNTPPHQATLIGPGARLKDPLYNNQFFLTADLDYFLSLRKKKNLRAVILKETIVFMADSGVSSKFLRLRIFEVLKTYIKHFKILFLIPLIMRYLKKIISKNYF